jgi:phage terminase Nu1 subunit (DNA packaging protein)
MTEVDLSGLLGDLDDAVRTELASTPEVVDKGDNLDVDDLPITVRRWHKLTDAVAVVADLKNSTKLGTGKWAASTAGI